MLSDYNGQQKRAEAAGIGVKGILLETKEPAGPVLRGRFSSQERERERKKKKENGEGGRDGARVRGE